MMRFGGQSHSDWSDRSSEGSLVLGEERECWQDLDHEVLGSPRGRVLPERLGELSDDGLECDYLRQLCAEPEQDQQ